MKSRALAVSISVAVILLSLLNNIFDRRQLLKVLDRNFGSPPNVKREVEATKMTVLGDSFAAGIGNNLNPDGQPDKGVSCYQSNASYAGQLAARYQIQPQNYKLLACSGATLIDMMHCQIRSNLTQDTALDYDCGSLSTHTDDFGDPDIVTISLGASASGYFDVIKNCVYFPTSSGNCLNSMARANSSLQIMQQSGDTHTVLAEVLNSTDTHQKPPLNPKSLVVVNYPMPFNTDYNGPNCPSFAGHKPDPSMKLYLNGHIQALNNIIQSHTAMLNATYVDVNPVFNGHRFCDQNITDIWLNNPMNEKTFQAGWAQSLVNNDTDIDPIFGNITNFPAMTDSRNSKNEFLFAAFHPTINGHAAIMGAIVDALK